MCARYHTPSLCLNGVGPETNPSCCFLSIIVGIAPPTILKLHLKNGTDKTMPDVPSLCVYVCVGNMKIYN